MRVYIVLGVALAASLAGNAGQWWLADRRADEIAALTAQAAAATAARRADNSAWETWRGKTEESDAHATQQRRALESLAREGADLPDDAWLRELRGRLRWQAPADAPADAAGGAAR